MSDSGRRSRRGVTEGRRRTGLTAEGKRGRQGRGSRVARRQALARVGSAGAGVVLAPTGGWAGPGLVAGRAGVVVAQAVSASTLRVTVLPQGTRGPDPVPLDGALVEGRWSPQATLSPTGVDEAAVGDFLLRVEGGPPRIRVGRPDGRVVQTIGIDEASGSATFDLGAGPLFGLGEGGPQFDRRGAAYAMRNGQGGYELHTHGAVVPIQWLVSSDGWALYVHLPLGSFDLRGERGRFDPPEGSPLPLDLFVVDAPDPAATMGEWARLTGRPEMPPLWSLGYQQSHRTLCGPEEVRWVARTLRAERLPCDTLIYLGTGFCPSGWNTQNGEFTWNPETFPDPEAQLEELHAMGFKVVVHVVLEGKRLIGTVSDPSLLEHLPVDRPVAGDALLVRPAPAGPGLAGAGGIGAREVDLETMPLYVRAGAIVPLGPVRQHTGQHVDEPLTLVVYPGAGGRGSVYEDDGLSFAYRRGEWMRMVCEWNDARRQLSIRPAEGSRMLPPLPRRLRVRIASESSTREAVFEGRPITLEV
jgi:hypothetical protein